MAPEQVAARAADMYPRAAQQGNFEAELKLGDYHYYGQGTPVDLEAAVYHYRTAAEARNAQAMFNLAWMYAHGSWWKVPSTLFDGPTPSARLVAPRAQAAPTRPRAQPEQLGSAPWPQ